MLRCLRTGREAGQPTSFSAGRVFRGLMAPEHLVGGEATSRAIGQSVRAIGQSVCSGLRQSGDRNVAGDET
jgi:hypothetical protein